MSGQNLMGKSDSSQRNDVWANRALFDRLILGADGEPAGMVDDLELTERDGQLEWTAILCGPTALGPRIGGRIGAFWYAVGRRLRPYDDPSPLRIPLEVVASVSVRDVRLRVEAQELGLTRLRDWVQDKVIDRIPGNGGAR